MSIRLLAQDLYRCIREIDILARQIAQALPHQQEELQTKLRTLKAERDRLRQALEGAKT
jgi:histidinol-phosphate/aromatic aminotransferase/cobyric acid decarboxylase-like protein